MKEKKKKYQYTALALGVVTVAIEGEVNDWTAYIGKTEGKNHYKESFEVARHGTKLPYHIAKNIFPEFDELFKWRY